MKNKKGFTLIELLVVIAIIAILSTVVLTGLSQSQTKAYDSKITQQLNGFRTSAQMYFANHTGYGSSDVIDDCGGAINTTLFNTIDTQDGAPGLLIDPANFPNFTHLTCNSNSREFSLKATLYTTGEYWCVDSTGASRKIIGTPDNNTFCPAL